MGGFLKPSSEKRNEKREAAHGGGRPGGGHYWWGVCLIHPPKVFQKGGAKWQWAESTARFMKMHIICQN